MEDVWRSLEQVPGAPEILPNLILLVIYEAIIKGPSPEWVGLTPRKRERKLVEIEKLSNRLRELVENTPLATLDAALFEQFGLKVPEIRFSQIDESDVPAILKSVGIRAAELRKEPPLLKKPKGKHSKRLLLFVRLNRLLEGYGAEGMYSEIAAIAGTVLYGDDPQETIDSETVRKAIQEWKRSRRG